MAKFNEYPAKTTPKDADKFMLYSAEDSANKLIDYDKLADAVLNKLTSKQFTLDQGNMTLLEALKQLNSKALIKNSMDISANNSTLTIKFPELNDLDLCALFAFVMLENQCYVSVQINHATIYTSKIVSFCGANIITGTETWNAEQKTFTVQMNGDYKSVYTSNCYVIK